MEEANEAVERAEHRRIAITVTAIVGALLLVALTGCCAKRNQYISKQNEYKLEKELVKLQLELAQSENKYLKNWQIRQKALSP